MIKSYKLIKQDTFNKLKLGKVYLIKDFGNCFGIVNTKEEKNQIVMYQITERQLDNMFEEVKEDEI